MLLFPQYEVKAPMPSACFRNVCKQMAKMHEAIYELLPEEQTQVRLNTTRAAYIKYVHIYLRYASKQACSLTQMFVLTDVVSED